MRISSIMAYGEILLEEQKQARMFLKKLFQMFPAYLVRYGLQKDPGLFLQ
jgi:hypothetical protein